MKQIAYIIGLLLVLATVSATETTLTPDSSTMDYVDVQIAEFCIEDNEGAPLDVDVVIDPICKDLNGLLGCNAEDEYDPAGFSVVPAEATTGADGCVDLTVTTNLGQEEGGLFYFTVNGQVAGTDVGAETGQIFVPEMGIIGAAVVLAGAGLFIARKRRD